MKRTTREDATRPADQNGQAKRHYVNKAGWLMAGEWCDRQAAFAALGRKLSTEHRRRA